MFVVSPFSQFYPAISYFYTAGTAALFIQYPDLKRSKEVMIQTLQV